jgi:hypothetical protein
MKLTTDTIRQLIKEELSSMLREEDELEDGEEFAGQKAGIQQIVDVLAKHYPKEIVEICSNYYQKNSFYPGFEHFIEGGGPKMLMHWRWPIKFYVIRETIDLLKRKPETQEAADTLIEFEDYFDDEEADNEYFFSIFILEKFPDLREEVYEKFAYMLVYEITEMYPNHELAIKDEQLKKAMEYDFMQGYELWSMMTSDEEINKIIQFVEKYKAAWRTP